MTPTVLWDVLTSRFASTSFLARNRAVDFELNEVVSFRGVDKRADAHNKRIERYETPIFLVLLPEGSTIKDVFLQ